MKNLLTVRVVLKETREILPYNYCHKFKGYVSNLLGCETYNTKKNDYVFSFLCGGRLTKRGIIFHDNPFFYFRTSDQNVWNLFTQNLKEHTKLFGSFEVLGWEVVPTNLKKTVFETDAASPILVSKKYSYVNDLSSDQLKDTENYLVSSVLNKANEYGFNVDDNLKISIIKQRMHRDVAYKGAINKGRNVKLRIECNEDTKAFILSQGLGRSTGIGFGFIF